MVCLFLGFGAIWPPSIWNLVRQRNQIFPTSPARLHTWTSTAERTHLRQFWVQRLRSSAIWAEKETRANGFLKIDAQPIDRVWITYPSYSSQTSGRAMRRPLDPRDQLLLGVVFGAIVAYLCYGAIVGDQFIPYKRQAGGVHLSGFWAWVVASGPAITYVSIQVRHGFIAGLGSRRRVALELGLLALGLVAFLGGIRMGVDACGC